MQIKGSQSYGGGICGTNNSSGVIKSCYNTGTVYCKETLWDGWNKGNDAAGDCKAYVLLTAEYRKKDRKKSKKF